MYKCVHIFLYTCIYIHTQSQLQIGICHPPLQGLNQVLLKMLTFNTPWRELRLESGKKALWALGKLAGRVFRELDLFRSWFYEPRSCVSSHTWKGTKFLHGDDCSSWLVKPLQKNKCLTSCIPPHQNPIDTDLPLCLFGASFRAIRGAVSGAACPSLPQTKLSWQHSFCAFESTIHIHNWVILPCRRN